MVRLRAKDQHSINISRFTKYNKLVVRADVQPSSAMIRVLLLFSFVSFPAVLFYSGVTGDLWLRT